jgi:HEPN domain-containing protein
VNRMELRQLAEDRILDAKVLLDAGRWTGAYYLAGYAVECGLKACILAYVEKTGAIFENKKFLEGCWTHELEKLLVTADLQIEFGIARGANPALEAYWGPVKDWKEISRYEQKGEREARQLYEAITNQPNGVLQWIKAHW